MGLHKLLGKLLEGLHEFLLLVRLTLLPLLSVHLVKHGLVDVVNKCLEDAHCVLRDFSEEHILAVGQLMVYGHSGFHVSHEIDSLASQFDTVA